MKQRTVFKVLLNNDHQLTSITQRRYSITYKPDTWIKPKIGKIFAFTTQVHAENFAEMFIGCRSRPTQIWKATGKNPSKMKEICRAPYNVKDFWDGILSKIYKMGPLAGTIVVDELKLLERVV